MRHIFRDIVYKADALEEIFKDSFGENLRIFDYPEGGRSACKVAVTATTTHSASTRLLTNDNGAYETKGECGMCVTNLYA